MALRLGLGFDVKNVGEKSEYKSALVLGCGRSGVAAEALLRSEGVETLVLNEDACDIKSFKSHVSTFHPEIAIVSPGFSLEHSWIQELISCGVPLLSELELGWSRRRCPVIAVTGSNGKSTVVKWIADALAHAGKVGVPCGNYGFPVSAAVMLPEVPDWLVIEVSSFQLETVEDFCPEIGVLLNILPNHLDRHGDMETYRNLKLRLFEKMTLNEVAILPFDFCQENPGTPVVVDFETFGMGVRADYCFQAGKVRAIDLSGTYFDNDVLGSAAAAVAAVANACGLPQNALEASARTFEPLPHRMETVAKINGVRFIDDSKATNLAGMCAALRMVSGPIHLIAGGRAKEIDLSFAKDFLVKHVSRLYLIGEASEAMHAAWATSVECLPCETLEKAVSAAAAHARSGDTVLLSPACTSFDQFHSFGERGDAFVREVGCLFNEYAGDFG